MERTEGSRGIDLSLLVKITSPLDCFVEKDLRQAICLVSE